MNEDAINSVYTERNAVVVAFARLAASTGIKVAAYPAEDAPGFHVVYIDLPTGQVSWHIPDDESELLSILNTDIQWDGHGTPEKYHRLHHFAELLIDGRS